MNFLIRDLQKEKAGVLKKLARTNFSFVEGLFIGKPKLGIIAEAEDGDIAGAAFLVTTQCGPKKIGYVDIMFVLPKYRGSGVAKMLYHGAVERLHGLDCNIITGLVLGDNSRSLCRFQAEGMNPVSLAELRNEIGLSGIVKQMIKTAPLACGTGCFILADFAKSRKESDSIRRIARAYFINTIIMALGFGVILLSGQKNMACWYFLTSMLLFSIFTWGETIGKKLAGGEWYFQIPESGFVISLLVAVLGGFYPTAGHWYLSERNNSAEYRRRMAMPAKCAWISTIIVTVACILLRPVNQGFEFVVSLCSSLLFLYSMPFYPFNTYCSKRIIDHSLVQYIVLLVISVGLIVYLLV